MNDTITINGPTAGGYTITSTDNTATGLYWGVNTISQNQVLTSNGSSSGWATISADPNLTGRTLTVRGDAEFDGEVTIKGKSLTDMLEKIEERLAILHPNPKLEDKWDELKELGKRYKELEAEIIEKEKVWSILKR
jgi:hypothetical protein